MKVLFLDIDGVMNSHVFYENRWKRRWLTINQWWYLLKKLLIFLKLRKETNSQNYKTPKNYYTFESQFESLREETCKEKWGWLSNWCNDNDIKICISSVWKNHFGDEDYNTKSELWEDALIKLGFKPGTFVGITGGRRNLRGEEIKEWLDSNPAVIDYAILDDDSDMLKEQMCKFHHCDGWFGMSPNHLYRIKMQFDGRSTYEHLSKTV